MFNVKTFEWNGTKVVARDNIFADIAKAIQFFNDLKTVKLVAHARFTSHNRVVDEF